MNAFKQPRNSTKNGPSTFALLIDDIQKMSESEQKLLWLQINKEKLSALAKELDNSVTPHNLSQDEITEMISEAKKYARSTKKS